MRRRLGIPLLLTALLLAAGAARAEIFQNGNLRVSFDGDFAPHRLPRDRAVAVTVSVEGSIATTDGSHPPPLRRLEIGLNRHGHLTTRGLPSCSTSLLQSTTSATALSRCRPALVGRGTFKADVDLNHEGLPAEGKVLVFNSSRGWRSGLALHIYGTVPVQATFVLPLTITRRDRGEFGTVLTASVPRLAGGLGSITEISMSLGRSYRYRGQHLSLISASCAAPAGFDLAIFAFAKGTFTFVGGRQLKIALTRDCRVRQSPAS